MTHVDLILRYKYDALENGSYENAHVCTHQLPNLSKYSWKLFTDIRPGWARTQASDADLFIESFQTLIVSNIHFLTYIIQKCRVQSGIERKIHVTYSALL